MEQLDYNLLFRWFVGLGIDDPVWDHSTYSKNRDRLLEADIARRFLNGILEHPKVAPLLSDEHFTVDGTLVNAWASMKSFVPKEPPPGEGAPPEGGAGSGGPPSAPEAEPPAASGAKPEPEAPAESSKAAETAEPEETAPMQTATPERKSRNAEVDFHGQKRSNDTHASTTDPEARLLRKGPGKEARLCFMGHAMTENRNGLVVGTGFTLATGTAEREAAIAMLERHRPGSRRRITVSADKGYDTSGFVGSLRAMGATPHVAQKVKGSAIDGRTTRHAGYKVSQQKRKLVEEPFGWGKVIGGLDRPMLKGVERQGFRFTFTMAAYDLVRLPKLVGGFRLGLAAGPQAA
jgi:hypothetical protein